MATARKKSAAKPKPAVRKAAKPVKSAKASKATVTKGKPVKARPAPKSSAPKAKAPPSKAKPAPVQMTKAVVQKPVVGARSAKGVPPKKGKPVVPPPVRPLGVLPPSAVARATAKPAAPVAVRPRPTGTPTPRAAAATQGAQRVTEEELKEFETLLLEQRRKILKEMGHLENTVLKVNQRDSSGDLSGYSFHMADAGTDAMEREKAFLFASAEGRTLMEIDEALRRLYRGEYGICESCGQPIARARLQAMPVARLCVSCKENEERAQRGAV
jgi:RNA polymerase-binding protein DksA